MGGNRRNRGGNSSQNQHQNRNKEVASSSPRTGRSNAFVRDSYQQNDVILAEIERGLTVSWKDISYLCSALVIVLIYGGVVGMAAGTSISIHWFEKSLSETHPSTSASASFQLGLMPNPSASRITSFHSASFLANQLPNGMPGLNYHKSVRPGVLPSTSFGSTDTLMLVEESVPLGSEASATDSTSETACSENDSCVMDGDGKSDQNSDGSSPKLSTSQAKLFVTQYEEWLRLQPKFQPSDPVVKPTTCRDGSSGFDDWRTLRNAIHEANSISEERSALWSSYFASSKHVSVFEDDWLYYEDDVIFRICPGETLRARRGPITVNAANFVLECRDCTIDAGGTHLTFGPRAKNILVKGVTFRGATASSLTFFHDGAEAIFEDCTWISNTGVTKKNGAVADVNSTSAVKFYRCSIGYGSERTWFGGRSSSATVSSLSIRA